MLELLAGNGISLFFLPYIKLCANIKMINTTEATNASILITNLKRNTLSIIRVFFKSIIGPKIKKPRMDEVGNILLNEANPDASKKSLSQAIKTCTLKEEKTISQIKRVITLTRNSGAGQW